MLNEKEIKREIEKLKEINRATDKLLKALEDFLKKQGGKNETQEKKKN